ncbi:hypothetical protein B0H17DRAFT_1174093 [Mycena rosella]|uniref:Uncharacterized protein n=1 Tax=Mycena rosella TaxID=1033263 RepID=A0AAD7GZT7_MYCRO|nr:hypothetical protein B0H17DRAFT_1174093 [Mycena rosella]
MPMTQDAEGLIAIVRNDSSRTYHSRVSARNLSALQKYHLKRFQDLESSDRSSYVRVQSSFGDITSLPSLHSLSCLSGFRRQRHVFDSYDHLKAEADHSEAQFPTCRSRRRGTLKTSVGDLSGTPEWETGQYLSGKLSKTSRGSSEHKTVQGSWMFKTTGGILETLISGRLLKTSSGRLHKTSAGTSSRPLGDPASDCWLEDHGSPEDLVGKLLKPQGPLNTVGNSPRPSAGRRAPKTLRRPGFFRSHRDVGKTSESGVGAECAEWAGAV